MGFWKQQPPAEIVIPEQETGWRIRGSAVLDLALTHRTIVEQFEPTVDVRAAADWGGNMDGTLEVTDEGIAWAPSPHARRFGFDDFHLGSDDIADIRVTQNPRGGEVEIDLTDHRKVAVRVTDPERWQTELDHAIGI